MLTYLIQVHFASSRPILLLVFCVDSNIIIYLSIYLSCLYDANHPCNDGVAKQQTKFVSIRVFDNRIQNGIF